MLVLNTWGPALVSSVGRDGRLTSAGTWLPRYVPSRLPARASQSLSVRLASRRRRCWESCNSSCEARQSLRAGWIPIVESAQFGIACGNGAAYTRAIAGDFVALRGWSLMASYIELSQPMKQNLAFTHRTTACIRPSVEFNLFLASYTQACVFHSSPLIKDHRL